MPSVIPAAGQRALWGGRPLSPPRSPGQIEDLLLESRTPSHPRVCPGSPGCHLPVFPDGGQQRSHVLTAGLCVSRQDPRTQSKPLPLPTTALQLTEAPGSPGRSSPPAPAPVQVAGYTDRRLKPQPTRDTQTATSTSMSPCVVLGGCGHFLTHRDSKALRCEDAELSGSSWAHPCGLTSLAGVLTPGRLPLACLGAGGLCSQCHVRPARPGCPRPASLSLADVRDSLPSLRGQQRSWVLLPQR